jgi:phosphoglucomutase
MTHPAAGTRPAPHELVDLPALVTAYYTRTPDVDAPAERVAFGTSGHRGASLASSFNEAHILAITQAICEHRAAEGITGPLFLGADTHALSTPAHETALEVLAANGVPVCIAPDGDYVPTPALSHAILVHNAAHPHALADGIGITPSHNPPTDGGFKYNTPHGGPADTGATRAIEARANALLAGGLRDVRRVSVRTARAAARVHDFRAQYVDALASVLDLDAIREGGVRAAVHPLGGAGVHYWPHIAERYALPLTVLDTTVDATFRFMTRDWDGQVRMDPSSPYAMAGVLEFATAYDVTIAADTDHDRHGVVTRSRGLLPPNHYLAVCIDYLLTHRPAWRADIGIGKTIVSSSLIDRVVARHGRALHEVPVGFKWFVPGLMDCSLGFVGEESAGATFLRRDGRVFTTDKDGLIAGLLAVELTARTGRDPGEHYTRLAELLGAPSYARIDAPASRAQKARLGALSRDDITARTLAGDAITAVLTHAPGNDAAIGGVKVCTEHGWFAARPSGTEDVYKIYAESFRGPDHLAQLQREAQALVDGVLRDAEDGGHRY